MNMKKLLSIVMASLLCVGVAGCSNGKQEDGATDKTANLEHVDKAMEVFDKNMRNYQMVGEASGTRLSVVDGELEVIDYTESSKEERLLFDQGFYSIIFQDDVSQLSKYDNKQKIGQSVLVKDNGELFNDPSEWKLSETVHASDIEGWKSYCLERFEPYFECTMKEQDNHKILTFECVDLKGYNEKYYADLKETNPTYDPLDFNGIKLSKNEWTQHKIEFILDMDYNLLTMNVINGHDYGEGLSEKREYTLNYSKMTEPTYTIEEIDSFLAKVKK